MYNELKNQCKNKSEIDGLDHFFLMMKVITSQKLLREKLKK